MKHLIASLIKFQQSVKAIPKNKINPHYKSKYAELSVVIDVCQPALNAAGLAVIQTLRTTPEDNILVTHLLHDSGESISSDVYLPRIQEPQKLTSAITYLRRASYLSIVGLTADDDLDGNDTIERSDDRPGSSGTSAYKGNGFPASEAQKGALKKMGIEFDANISKDDASKLIAQRMKK